MHEQSFIAIAREYIRLEQRMRRSFAPQIAAVYRATKQTIADTSPTQEIADAESEKLATTWAAMFPDTPLPGAEVDDTTPF